jgi:hypothetical protein
MAVRGPLRTASQSGRKEPPAHTAQSPTSRAAMHAPDKSSTGRGYAPVVGELGGDHSPLAHLLLWQRRWRRQVAAIASRQLSSEGPAASRKEPEAAAQMLPPCPPVSVRLERKTLSPCCGPGRHRGQTSGFLEVRRSGGTAVDQATRLLPHIVIRSTSSSVISSPVRSWSFVVRRLSCAAIAWAFSNVPPVLRYAVMPVARNE